MESNEGKKSQMEYEEKVAKMEDEFLLLVNRKDGWDHVTTRENPLSLQVYKLAGSKNCFKIIAVLNTSAETAFDVLSDIRRRVEWDEIAETGITIENISNDTRIDYLKTKPIWPTSGRDSILLSHVKILKDGRLLNVNQSIKEHSSAPVDPTAVRMETKVAGQIIEFLTPKSCRVIQVADADLNGWIPSSVVTFLANIAIPRSFIVLDEMLQKLPVQETSAVVTRMQSNEQVVTVTIPVTITKPKQNKLLGALLFSLRLVKSAEPFLVFVLFVLSMKDRFFQKWLFFGK